MVFTQMMYLYSALIFLLAGFTQGISGFGAALVAMPLLTIIMSVQTAVPLTMLQGLLITLFLSLQLKQHVDWKKILPLLFGCLPGIVLGIAALKSFNSDLLQRSMGVLIVAYSLYSLGYKPAPRTLSTWWAYLAGFLTGAISSAFSAGGPPAVIYASLSDWSKEEIKATLSVFFFTAGVITAAGHAASGLTTPSVLKTCAFAAPCTVLGVWAGSRCSNKMKRETYIKVMMWLLVVMGIMMIVSAG